MYIIYNYNLKIKLIMYVMQWEFTQLHSFEQYFIDKLVEKKLFYLPLKSFYGTFTVHMKVFC